MANNRMYLKCQYCGATLPFAQHFMTPYLVATSISEIDKFFREHFICGGQYGNCFELEYEDNEYQPRGVGENTFIIDDATENKQTAEEIIRNEG